MSTTEFNASDNPLHQTNGIMYARKKTLQTMHRDLYLHPILRRVLRSRDLHSCISHLQRKHKLVRRLSSSNRKMTQRSDHWCVPALLTGRSLNLPLTAFSAFPPSTLYYGQWHSSSIWQDLTSIPTKTVGARDGTDVTYLILWMKWLKQKMLFLKQHKGQPLQKSCQPFKLTKWCPRTALCISSAQL